MIVTLSLLALIVFLSCLSFLVGLVIVIFHKENKEFGIKLLTYSVIIMIIGFGSCVSLANFAGI